MPTLPCALCDSDIPAGATVCPWCGGDPAAERVPCPECNGSGEVEVPSLSRASCAAFLVDAEPYECRTCGCCDGAATVEAPYAHLREQAKEAA